MTQSRDSKGRFLKIVANPEPTPLEIMRVFAHIAPASPIACPWHPQHGWHRADSQCPVCVAEQEERKDIINRLSFGQRFWLWLRFGRGR